MRRVLLVVLILVLFAWGQSAFYSVDQAEFAYVTRFGEPVGIRDGTSDAGLHVKWPWPIESVDRIDHRLHTFDLPPTETQTRDPLRRTVNTTLTVDAYVCWRIPTSEAADRFHRTVKTTDEARRILMPRISSRLAAVIGSMPMDEWIKVADQGTGLAFVSSGSILSMPGLWREVNEQVIDQRMEKIRRRVMGVESIGSGDRLSESLPKTVLDTYGIEIVDIRLRRFNNPVRDSIIATIAEERERKAKEFRNEGNENYTKIVEAANLEAARMVNKAIVRRQQIENEARTEALRIRGRAQELDPTFFEFLEKIKSFRTMMGETRDTLLLSTKHEPFKSLVNPPQLPGAIKQPMIEGKEGKQ